MIVMSLNYPFMIHAASYTFSGIFLLSIYYYEKKIDARIKKWANKQASQYNDSLIKLVPYLDQQTNKVTSI